MMKWLRDDTGAALITVMMFVAVMSAVAVTALDRMKGEVQRFIGDHSLIQAREYALAAEVVGVIKAEKFVKNESLLAQLGLGKDAGTLTIPIDNGDVKGRLSEISNCFNLTSLVRLNDQETHIINEEARLQFIRLLSSLGLGSLEAESLAAALIDWQDSDNRPIPMGAEDNIYSLLQIPYRTNNKPLIDIRELRLVRGYTPALINALRPFVCVESSLETKLNINSIHIEKALLIAAILGGDLSQQEAVSLIDARPVGGYDNAAQFWQQDALKDRDIPQTVRAQIGFKPIRFLLKVDVNILHVRQRLSAVIKFYPDGSHRVLHRQFGSG